MDNKPLKANAKNEPRMMPNDLEAEQSLLGCIFISTTIIDEVFSNLTKDDFYSRAHQEIFDAMNENYLKNTPIDYITVSRVLDQKAMLENVGGLGYITDLTNAVPSAANYKHYIEIIRNDSMLRQIINNCQESINHAYVCGDSAEALALAEKNIFDLSRKYNSSDLVHIRKSMAEALDMMEKLAVDPNSFAGVKTGFPTLDKMTNGFKGGELIILAARPGIGKTTLAVNMAMNAALQYKKSIAIFNLEMSSLQVAQRVLASIGGIPMDMVKKGTKDNATWTTLFETQKIIEDANIYVDDTTNVTPAMILSKCRRLKNQVGLDMIIVDYLQLMQSGKSGKDASRQQEVSELTRSIKLASRELNVPIVLLSQLNRESEKRVDKTPQLSDLRESGSIEQDADIVMFISGDVQKDENGNDVGMTDGQDFKIVIAKHRNGPRGNVDIKWMSELTKFYESGSNFIYTRNTSKTNKNTGNAILTSVEDSDIDDAFKE